MAHAGEGGKFPLNLDPRCVLVSTFSLSIVAACLYNLTAATVALFAGIVLLLYARPPLRHLARRLVAANIFIAFIWLVVPWTMPGATVWQAGFVSISREGIQLSLLATVKANAIICIFLALAAPLSIAGWGNALRGLHCPDRLIWIFLLMGRNIFILGSVWQNMYAAARLRGFSPRGGPRSWRILANMLAFLLIRASERGEKMREAMLLRGFSGKLPYAGHSAMGKRDVVFSLFVIAIIACMLWVECFFRMPV